MRKRLRSFLRRTFLGEAYDRARGAFESRPQVVSALVFVRWALLRGSREVYSWTLLSNECILQKEKADLRAGQIEHDREVVETDRYLKLLSNLEELGFGHLPSYNGNLRDGVRWELIFLSAKGESKRLKVRNSRREGEYEAISDLILLNAVLSCAKTPSAT